jgi:1-acylglycerone phosphate reductase
MKKTQKYALVTGCTPGGLGFALAKAFRDQGYHVLATVRNAQKAGILAEENDIEVLALDVTSAESIASCVEKVRTATGGRLDILVNNAGTAIFGPLVHASIEEGKAAYDVNVWGPLAVSQAFAPFLIESKGIILNISSIAGAVPLAWQGASNGGVRCWLTPLADKLRAGLYNSSKAALTFISETLKMELAPLGVRVVTAMVGAIGTQLYDNHEVTLPEGSWYKSIEEPIKKQSRGEMQQPFNEPVDITARNLVKDTLAGRRGQIWRGGEAGRASVLSWLVPTGLRERILHAERGLYQLKYEN